MKLQRFECRSILSKAAGGVIFNGLANPSEDSLFVPHELELLAPAVFSLKGTGEDPILASAALAPSRRKLFEGA